MAHQTKLSYGWLCITTTATQSRTQVRADIEVTCYTYEGIDAVKAALIAGKAVGDERTPIQIKLIAPPRYVMDTMTLDKDLGKSVLEKAIEVVTEKIIESGGKLEVSEWWSRLPGSVWYVCWLFFIECLYLE